MNFRHALVGLGALAALDGCEARPTTKHLRAHENHNTSVTLCTRLIREMLSTKMRDVQRTVSVTFENPADSGHGEKKHPGISRVTVDHTDGESASCLFNPALPYATALQIARTGGGEAEIESRLGRVDMTLNAARFRSIDGLEEAAPNPAQKPVIIQDVGDPLYPRTTRRDLSRIDPDGDVDSYVVPSSPPDQIGTSLPFLQGQPFRAALTLVFSRQTEIF